jgi:hypothetical protein
MTYNFDPDQWYENELAVIRSRAKTGELSEKAYNEAIEELEEKVDAMWDRLNGSYQIPK